jgi:ElaB/YqjD/DUF883 family membrane-anchored ribosome-binding protein
MAENQESEERSGGNGNSTTFGFSQATEAVEKLRSVVEQASQSIRDLTQASEQWAQERAREMGKELRVQGERAVGTVSEQVEHNPLASLAIAFAVGYLIASLTRR